MKDNQLIIKTSLLLAAVVALVWFNQTSFTYKSAQQVTFDNWLSTSEPALRQGKLNETEPARVTLSIQQPNQAPVTYSVSATSNGDSNEHVLRLLELLRESNFFSLSESSIASVGSEPTAIKDIGAAPSPYQLLNNYEVTITVVQGGNHFETGMSKDALMANIPAKNMLKLLQVYALEASNTRTALQAETPKGRAKIKR